jgi:hypothetical protein
LRISHALLTASSPESHLKAAWAIPVGVGAGDLKTRIGYALDPLAYCAQARLRVYFLEGSHYL